MFHGQKGTVNTCDVYLSTDRHVGASNSPASVAHSRRSSAIDNGFYQGEHFADMLLCASVESWRVVLFAFADYGADVSPWDGSAPGTLGGDMHPLP